MQHTNTTIEKTEMTDGTKRDMECVSSLIPLATVGQMRNWSRKSSLQDMAHVHLQRKLETLHNPTRLPEDVFRFLSDEQKNCLKGRYRLFIECLSEINEEFHEAEFDIRAFSRFIPIVQEPGFNKREKKALLLRLLRERQDNPQWTDKGDISWVRKNVEREKKLKMQQGKLYKQEMHEKEKALVRRKLQRLIEQAKALSEGKAA